MSQEQTAIVVKGIKQAYKNTRTNGHRCKRYQASLQKGAGATRCKLHRTKGGIVRHSSDDKPVIGANSSVIRHNQKWRGYMSHSKLSDVATHIREQAAAYCASNKIPGYLAGVYHGGDQAVVAHGVTNIVTGAPMFEDTGFLFGSVTKLLTTTLVLQQVERGVIDLDERVIKYLPEFKLTTPEAAEKIRVRNLLTHTNGIDADLFFLDAKGHDALKAFVEGLGQYCGVLFGPDEYISYSNGGMIVEGRLLEVVTGTPYHDLLKREVYAPIGMDDSCTSAEEAILRSTAIGHFPDDSSRWRRITVRETRSIA